MSFWSQTTWRHSIIVALYATCLFWIFNIQRIPVLIDFYQLRSVTHLDNFNARQAVSNGHTQVLTTTALDSARYSANIGSVAHTIRMIEFELDPLPSGLKRRIIATAIDGRRFFEVQDVGKTTTYQAIIPSYITLNPDSELTIFSIPDVETTPPAITVRSLTVSEATVYRWSRSTSIVDFTGIADGWWQVNIQAALERPNGQSFQAYIQAGKRVFAPLDTPQTGFRTFQYLVDPQALPSGDLKVSIHSDALNDPSDPRELGIPITTVGVEPLTTSWWHITPSLQLASMIVIAVFITFASIMLGYPNVLIGLSVTTALAGAMLIDRSYLPEWYPVLCIIVITSTLSIPVWYHILRWLSHPELGFGSNTANLIVMMVIVSIWLKAGGVFWPFMVPIDISWHMDKVREMIATGNLAKFYVPGSFSESVMPVTEWGADRPMIPYSPFYHFSSLLYAVFPWALESSAMVVSIILDVSRIVFIAVIARANGLSERTSAWAASIYAITPLTFLLHSWGNTPTTTGLWWTLACTTALVFWSSQLRQPRVFWSLVGITSITMLIYTVTAVFHVLFILTVAGIWWLQSPKQHHMPIREMLSITFIGLTISVVVYYGQYIMPIIERTIPYFINLGLNDSSAVGVERPGFVAYMQGYTTLLHYSFAFNGYLYYGLYIPMLLAIPGFLWLRRFKVLWSIMAAWYLIAVLFMFVGMRISMVDKQIFYILPIVSICSAVMFVGWWRRGISGQIMGVTIILFTLWSALQLWVYRIQFPPVIQP
jgi:hypothetical protein